MVRLRTDRWYGAEGQRRHRLRATQEVSGTRRLWSLCLLLALVLVLMQKAADPRHVRDAFQALGVPLAAAPAGQHSTATSPSPGEGAPTTGHSTVNSAAASGLQAAGPDSLQTPWEATCRDLTQRLLEPCTDAEISSLARRWFAVPAGSNDAEQSAVGQPAAAEQLPRGPDRLESLYPEWVADTQQSGLSPEATTAWLDQLDRFRQQWLTVSATFTRYQLPVNVSPELTAAISDYLDQRLLASLRDAAPWSAAESIAFWRLLQREPVDEANRSSQAVREPQTQLDNPSREAPYVSTLQLVAEGPRWGGQSVRFQGSVRRAGYVPRDFPDFGIAPGYWVLWLRGTDRHPQPVAVYTRDPQAAELAARLAAAPDDFPELDVVADFAKRLAYASPSGVQLAPALFARQLVRASTPPSPLATASAQTPVIEQLPLALALAAILAGAMLTPIVWTFRRPSPTARRRQLTSIKAEASSRRRGRVTHCGIAILCWLSGGLLAVAQLSPQPQSPAVPWREKETTDPRLSALLDSLRTTFAAPAAEHLQAYHTSQSDHFPDAILKAMQALRRFGWQRAAELCPTRVELGPSFELRKETVSGWVRMASPVALNPTQESWFQADERPQLFRLEVQLLQSADQLAVATDATDATVATDELRTIYCQQVPSQWLQAAQLRQPARFDLLTFGTTEPALPPLCSLAQSPRWLLPPDTQEAPLAKLILPPLPEHLLSLGQSGWDLSQLDAIAAQHLQPLSAAEAAGFYSLIQLAEMTALPADRDLATDHWQLSRDREEQPLQVLADAQQWLGAEVDWLVRIVSGSEVAVDDPQAQRWLGGTHYVQYDGFVQIGNHRIRVRAPSDAAAEMREFVGEYPVTIVCSNQLPRLDKLPSWGEPAASEQTSWPVGRYGEVQGRFYRMWSYGLANTAGSATPARQAAPLIVAARILPSTAPARSAVDQTSWFGWGLCAALLVILGSVVGLTLSSRRPVKLRRKKRVA